MFKNIWREKKATNAFVVTNNVIKDDDNDGSQGSTVVPTTKHFNMNIIDNQSIEHSRTSRRFLFVISSFVLSSS